MTHFSLLLAFTLAMVNVAPLQDDTQLKIADNIANNLGKKQYDDVRKDFANGLNRQLSVEMIRKAWENLLDQNGAFDKIMTTTKTTVQGYPVVKVRCKFENENANVEVTFNDDNQVIGLFLKP